MTLTGPYILTKTLKNYETKNNDNSINVLDYKYLMPFYASEKNVPNIKTNCIETENIVN